MLASGLESSQGEKLGAGFLDDLPLPTAPLVIADRYRVLEVIGRGGMGVVYKAWQENLDRVVAVKMVSSGQHASETEKERFLAEAKAAARLEHPGIVGIHDWGEDEGVPYFSMEYVEGKGLNQRVQNGPLPAAEAARIVKAIAEAVQYAHEQGVLHRDLKPSNILIGKDGRPQITDFGLAKRLDNPLELTLSGQTIGTPGYMPPEQVSAKRGTVGPPSDVYGLGALLYCLLTGRPPFLGSTTGETLNQVLEAEVVSPKRLNPAIPRDLETVCLKCLEKEVRRRYRSAQELADELGRFLTGEPVRARPVNLAEKLIKWVRRRPGVATLSALALAMLVGGIAGIELKRREAVYERERALEQEGRARRNETVAQKERDRALALKQNVDALVSSMVIDRIKGDLQKINSNSVSGLTFELSCEDNVQEILAEELENARRQLSAKAVLGIVMNPKTGDIVGLVSRPRLGSNDINPVISRNIEPGFAFSTVVVAAALNEQLVDLETKIDCENGRFHYAGSVLRDENEFGIVSVRELLSAKPSRIGVAKLALRLGNDRFRDYISHFGFGELTGVSLPGESKGAVRSVSDWRKSEPLLISIGHGVLATPLQIARAFAVIANGGKLMAPRLIHSVKDSSGREIVAYEPEMIREVLLPETARAIKNAYHEHVEVRYPKAKIDGFKVAGVGSTTQKVVNGVYGHVYLCLFAGFLPVDDPQFLCLVVIDEPSTEFGRYYSSQIAAPLFSRISKQVVRYLMLKTTVSRHSAAGTEE